MRAWVARRQLTDRLPAFGIPLVRDRAGVDHAQIGRLVRGGILIADTFQRLADKLRFILVHFATQRDGAETRMHGFLR